MKFCTKCGEVYPSEVKSCNIDGAVLEVWSRTSFDAKDDPDHALHTSQLDDDADDDAEVTSVESMPCSPETTTTQQQLPDDNTAVFDISDPVTLTEFDVHSSVAPLETGDKLVVYDDEVSGPFQGMLISNRYRLEGRIGTGGFGVVFDAYDKQEDKRVAIKVLSPALSEDKRALMRFRREAIAVGRLEHPGIVSISDFGIEDEGVSYIVMEYLPGRDVAALLEDEKFVSAKRAASLVMQCAEALSAAHEEGVLHRDLKPANIFVIQDSELVERIKIIDFGIAKDRSSNPRMRDITAASKVVGTPFYMSPEQASGNDLDGRADVYSLGVILFELLTGERPFDGPSVYDILMAHGNAKRIEPSKIRHELRNTPNIDALVLRAIDPRREHRFQSMKDFSEALRVFLEDGGGHASASSLRLSAAVDDSRKTTLHTAIAPEPPTAITTTPKRLPRWPLIIPVLALVVAVAMIGGDTKNGSADSQESPRVDENKFTPSTSAPKTVLSPAAHPETTPAELQQAGQELVDPPEPVDTDSEDAQEQGAQEQEQGAQEQEQGAQEQEPTFEIEPSVETPSPRRKRPRRRGKRKTKKKTKGFQEW